MRPDETIDSEPLHSPASGLSRFRGGLRILSIFIPSASYAMFLFGAASDYGLVFGKAQLVLAALYLAWFLFRKNRPAAWIAYFLLGLGLVSFAEAWGQALPSREVWLRYALVPYAFGGAYLLGGWGAVLFILAVPALEARRLMFGLSAESIAIITLAVFSGMAGLFMASRKSRAQGLRDRQAGRDRYRDRQGNREPGRAMKGMGHTGPAMEEPGYAETAGEDEGSSYEMSPPVNMGGLEREEDESLRELLRIAVFATRASAVSFYIRSGDELGLRCSSMPQPAGRDDVTSPVPQWYVNDVLRLRHTIITGNLGAETTQGFVNRAVSTGSMAGGGSASAGTSSKVPPPGSEGEAVSIAAAPVLVGSMVTGVLAVNSPLSNAFRGNTVSVLELISAQVARTLSGSRVFKETERDMEGLRLVYEESARMVASIDLKEIVAIIADVTGKLSAMDVHVYIKTPSGFALAYGPPGQKPGRVDMDGTLSGMVLEEGEDRYLSSLKGYSVPAIPGEMGEGRFGSAMIIPLILEGEPYGLVALTSPEGGKLSALSIERLKLVGRQAAISLKNSLLHTEARMKAATDPLTGLNNRRRFMEAFKAEHNRFLRTASRYAVVMMDVDFFKKVNDNHGHQAGDEVLMAVASVMRQSFRTTDILGRYGGEEFAAVLVETDEAGAMSLAERMREATEKQSVETGPGVIRVTMSLGVALVREGEGPEAVLQRADEALYRAKESGRNRVVLSG